MKVAAQHYTPTTRPTTQPVVIWSVIGALFLALALYVWIAWITGPDFKPTLPSQPLDATTSGFAFWNQVAFSIVTVICLLGWVGLPKVRTGRFSFMGLLVLASGTCYWQDPMSNYYSYGIAYNSGFWNMGSWANYIPGFSYPGQEKFPEAPFWVGTPYIWFNVAFPAMFAAIWRWVDRRFPSAGIASVIVSLLIFMFAIDVIQEALYLRMGLYSYVGAFQDWSVFGGHYYQFPVYIGVITAFFFLGVTWIIHFRDDKGFCFAERGVDKLKLSPGISTFLRFLALVGVMNVITLGTYFIPVQWMYTHGDAIPSDTPGYLHNNLCGEKAGFPCPGKGVPIPRRDGNTIWVNVPESK